MLSSQHNHIVVLHYPIAFKRDRNAPTMMVNMIRVIDSETLFDFHASTVMSTLLISVVSTQESWYFVSSHIE